MKMKKKALTLLEIMIVILLIGIVGSVVGYNVKGALNKGKKFKSDQGIARLYDIVSIQGAQGTDVIVALKDKSQEEMRKLMTQWVDDSGLFAKDPASMLFDGWGVAYVISIEGTPAEVKIASTHQ